MIETYPDSETMAKVAAQAVSDCLTEALARRGRASLVTTGGRSPGPVYDRLAALPLRWARIAVTLSDERCVEEDHPDSNAGLVRRRLLTSDAAHARFLPLWPDPGARALEALLPFDAVLLGMGEDGHVASLIPGDPGLEDALTTADFLRPVPGGLGKPPLARITLTLGVLADARAIFLLIAGAAKREVIQRVLAGEDLPVGRLLQRSRAPVRLLWHP